MTSLIEMGLLQDSRPCKAGKEVQDRQNMAIDGKDGSKWEEAWVLWNRKRLIRGPRFAL